MKNSQRAIHALRRHIHLVEQIMDGLLADNKEPAIEYLNNRLNAIIDAPENAMHRELEKVVHCLDKEFNLSIEAYLEDRINFLNKCIDEY